MPKKIKVCYILPFYEEGTDTHLFYNYELIKKMAALPAEATAKAGREVDLFLILEKKKDKPNFGVKFYEQKFKFPPLRFLELLFKCFKMRKQGYTNFYVHYSYYGALAAWLSSNLRIFSRLTLSTGAPTRIQKSEDLNFARVYYWNRGMPWLFKRGWIEEKVFRFILRHTILVTGPESLAKEYQKRYGLPAQAGVLQYRVLSNWVDVERFAPKNSGERLQNLTKAEVFQDFSQRNGARLGNLPAGKYAGLEKPAAKANASARIVLFVHHLSKRKGADLIPKIAEGFGDDVIFVVAGDGPEKENLEKLVSENSKLAHSESLALNPLYGGSDAHAHSGTRTPSYEFSNKFLEKPVAESRDSDNIVILGKVPNSEIPRLFHAADVFLMPSREEGSPHVILEAMASGAPFVASDIGGVREIVPEGLLGNLCPSEDIKCLQDKIKTLLANGELYKSTQRQCMEYAKKFDIERGVEEFIGLF